MRIILLIGFLLNSFFIHAQFIKGDKFLAGRISYSSKYEPGSQLVETRDVKLISIMPSFGFLLSDHFAVGGQLGYASSRYEIAYPSSQSVVEKLQSISIGAFGQWYFKLSDKFLFSPIGQVKFERGSETSNLFVLNSGSVVEVKTENYKLGASLIPVFIFIPTPKWGFELSVGSLNYFFTHNLSTDKNGYDFSFDYGTVSLGLIYYFRKAENVIE